MSSRELSQSDQRILTSVFDPENSPDTPAAKIDPSLPEDAQIKDAGLLARLRAQELQAVRLVEQHSSETPAVPKLAFGSQGGLPSMDTVNSEDNKSNVYHESLSILSHLIDDHPTYASAYNNRAQLRRWYHGDALLSRTALRSSDSSTNKPIVHALDAIFADLDRAIALASPSTSNSAAHGAAVSAAQGRLLAQVWTQRGAMLWGLARALSGRPPARLDGGSGGTEAGPEGEDGDAFDGRPVEQQFDLLAVPEWRAWDAAQLEEEGSRSFYMAGLYGSEVGRAMAVKTNPYARLCAGIVKEAMASEYQAYRQ